MAEIVAKWPKWLLWPLKIVQTIIILLLWTYCIYKGFVSLSLKTYGSSFVLISILMMCSGHNFACVTSKILTNPMIIAQVIVTGIIARFGLWAHKHFERWVVGLCFIHCSSSNGGGDYWGFIRAAQLLSEWPSCYLCRVSPLKSLSNIAMNPCINTVVSLILHFSRDFYFGNKYVFPTYDVMVWTHTKEGDVEEARSQVDYFMVMHSPNERHLPAFRAVQPDSLWTLENGGNSSQYCGSIIHCNWGISQPIFRPAHKRVMSANRRPCFISHWQSYCIQAKTV